MFISQMKSKPGDKDFTRDLHTIYKSNFLFPYQHQEAADVKQSLAEYWNMTDATSYMSGMERLLNRGHQEQFQKIMDNMDAGIAPAEYEKDHFDFIKTNRSQFPKGGIKSWDIARYVNNIALDYAAGYITKQEGEAMLENVPAIARNAYANWDDFWLTLLLLQWFETALLLHGIVHI